jgi:hypothetical protein
MTPSIVVLIAIAVIGALWIARHAYIQKHGFAEIEYRGETFALSKKYIDYDVYKNDPKNLADTEVPRIERMMTETPIGPEFRDWSDFTGQVFALKFPGYGMIPGPQVAADIRQFRAEIIEIPRVAKDRCFVVEEIPNGRFRLIDDFVIRSNRSSGYSSVRAIRVEDDKLIYTDKDSAVVRETKLTPP